jgi:hypothetical protein
VMMAQNQGHRRWEQKVSVFLSSSQRNWKKMQNAFTPGVPTNPNTTVYSAVVTN